MSDYLFHIDLNKTSQNWRFACGKSYKYNDIPSNEWGTRLCEWKTFEPSWFMDICKECLEQPDVQLHLLTLVG